MHVHTRYSSKLLEVGARVRFGSPCFYFSITLPRDGGCSWMLLIHTISGFPA
jgi:hypothetical protein